MSQKPNKPPTHGRRKQCIHKHFTSEGFRKG